MAFGCRVIRSSRRVKDDATKEEGAAAKDCKSCSRQNLWPQKRSISFVARELTCQKNKSKKVQQFVQQVQQQQAATGISAKAKVISYHLAKRCQALRPVRKKQRIGKRPRRIKRRPKKLAKMSLQNFSSPSKHRKRCPSEQTPKRSCMSSWTRACEANVPAAYISSKESAKEAINASSRTT